MAYQVPTLGPGEAERKYSFYMFCGELDGKPFFIVALGESDSQYVILMPRAAQVFARYRYTPGGARHDNITDWALDQFRAHYEAGAPSPSRGKVAGGAGRMRGRRRMRRRRRSGGRRLSR